VTVLATLLAGAGATTYFYNRTHGAVFAVDIAEEVDGARERFGQLYSEELVPMYLPFRLFPAETYEPDLTAALDPVVTAYETWEKHLPETSLTWGGWQTFTLSGLDGLLESWNGSYAFKERTYVPWGVSTNFESEPPYAHGSSQQFSGGALDIYTNLDAGRTTDLDGGQCVVVDGGPAGASVAWCHGLRAPEWNTWRHSLGLASYATGANRQVFTTLCASSGPWEERIAGEPWHSYLESFFGGVWPSMASVTSGPVWSSVTYPATGVSRVRSYKQMDLVTRTNTVGSAIRWEYLHGPGSDGYVAGSYLTTYRKALGIDGVLYASGAGRRQLGGYGGLPPAAYSWEPHNSPVYLDPCALGTNYDGYAWSSNAFWTQGYTVLTNRVGDSPWWTNYQAKIVALVASNRPAITTNELALYWAVMARMRDVRHFSRLCTNLCLWFSATGSLWSATDTPEWRASALDGAYANLAAKVAARQTDRAVTNDVGQAPRGLVRPSLYTYDPRGGYLLQLNAELCAANYQTHQTWTQNEKRVEWYVRVEPYEVFDAASTGYETNRWRLVDSQTVPAGGGGVVTSAVVVGNWQLPPKQSSMTYSNVGWFMSLGAGYGPGRDSLYEPGAFVIPVLRWKANSCTNLLFDGLLDP
jgi:hypothetical protein